MNLQTTYLGLNLKNPLVVGASPLGDKLDRARQLEDAGASAIVFHSLFEEQIKRDAEATEFHTTSHAESSAEATSYFPLQDEFVHGPDEYLAHLSKAREALSIPVIASLNGVTPGGWLEYAKRIEEAGADALELNLYHVPTDPAESAAAVESRLIQTVEGLHSHIKIPLSVKLSPYHTAPVHFTNQLVKAGARGLVLFNRFFQPDIDIELLEASPRLQLSESTELLLRLRWLAILEGQCEADLALTGGVHNTQDAIKSLMAGATVIQLVSSLLRHGPSHLSSLLESLQDWLTQHEYESIAQLRGCMSLKHCPDPAAYERGNYMRILQGWRM